MSMHKYKYFVFFCFLSSFSWAQSFAQGQNIALSFDEALQVMNGDNNSLKIADYEIKWATEERRGMNSLWYPKVSVDGAYTHFFTRPEIRQSLSPLTDPVKDFVLSLDPQEKLVSGFLDQMGGQHLTIPLSPQNTTSVNAVLSYPLFTGGRRLYATKIGKQIEVASRIAKQNVSAEQRVQLVQTYFGVRLGQSVVEVKRETYNSLEKHYQDALKLEANGMLTKAERLMFEVNRNEARRDLEVALKDLNLSQSAFRNLVKIEDEQNLLPTTALFINETLPNLSHFKELIASNNYALSALKIQRNIQEQQIKIANAAYLPNVELLGVQRVFSHGIDKHIIPRSIVGVGLSWNIFDGFDREKKIRQAKIKKDIIETEHEAATNDLRLAADQFYTQTQTALDNVTALKTTIEMSKELVRTRQKAFLEGMATSTEVIDAELTLSKVKLASLLAFYQFDLGLINLLSLSGIPESFMEYSLGGIEEKQILN